MALTKDFRETIRERAQREPRFRHGYSEGRFLWLFNEPTAYYRRHLLLHEGTHSFMATILGSIGPPWYAEGMAELMATHRLEDGRLTLDVVPAHREEVPDWGRIRLVKDAFAQRRAMRLDGILAYSSSAHLEVEPYAWCWAAAAMLDRTPAYRERFQQLARHVAEPDFNEQFRRAFARDWPQLNEQWAVFIAGIEYGYDFQRAAIDFGPGQPLRAEGAAVRVAADRGWQSSGISLSGGSTYRLEAAGRYQVATEPKILECEPGGISIRYYQGRPLGLLLAAVDPDASPPKGPTALLRPTVVGLGTTLDVQQSGTLYFKINLSAAELQQAAGHLEVKVNSKGRAD